ncbi:DoxX family protein [Brachybacterium sp. EF45031]|nr:DoxX family protein [Brachybacterium sillae]
MLLPAAQVVLSLVFLVSGAAKLGAAEQLQDAMRSLRLPARSLHAVAARVVPLAEIAGALLIWVPWRPLQVALAVAQLLLALAYLVIIVRALGFEEKVTCSCFGSLASPTVSGATAARNVLLVVLAGLALGGAVAGALASAVVTAPVTLLALAVALVMAMALTVLAMGGLRPDSASTPAPASAAARQPAPTRPSPIPGITTVDAEDVDPSEIGEDGMLDYERSVTPFGMMRLEDESYLSLREATAAQANLLLLINPGCGPCERVLDEVPGWERELEGIVQIRTLFSQEPSKLSPSVRERAGRLPAQDPEGNIRRAFAISGYPGAVLLGADGMTAGGPVVGGEGVRQFAEEIIEQIREARAAGELPEPAPEATPGSERSAAGQA